MTSARGFYDVEVHRVVARFFNRHADLLSSWEEISRSISESPKRGARISHLKGQWHCNYRWRQGMYRLIYEVLDDLNLVHVYEANTRGDVY